MVSPLVSYLPPKVDSWNPTRIPLETDYDNFSIMGDHFTSRQDMKVKVGAKRCTGLDIETRKMMTCDVPALPSGVHDLYVETFMGNITVPKAVVAYPAMDYSGTPAIGQPVTISLYGTTGDTYLTFLSFGTTSIPFPPFGTLCLDPAYGFFILFGGVLPANQLDFQGGIPNDPNYQGISVYFQSIIGSNFPTGGHLTNCIEMNIQ